LHVLVYSYVIPVILFYYQIWKFRYISIQSRLLINSSVFGTFQIVIYISFTYSYLFFLTKTSNLSRHPHIWSLLVYVSIHVSKGIFRINSYFYRCEYILTIEKKIELRKRKSFKQDPIFNIALVCMTFAISCVAIV